MYQISLDNKNLDKPRREFLKLSAMAALALAIPKKSAAVLKKLQQSQDIMNMSPIQVLKASEFNGLDFNGDNINRPHDILWDLSGYIQKKGGLPNPSEKRKVVVIGGGMSGLLSAYNLIDLNPVVLEQDKNFGGNSKGEIYQDATFSIGAAYITIPDSGSDIENFLKDISLFEDLKHETSEATKFTFKNKYMTDFWKGVTDPSRAQEFIKVDNELRRIYNDAYPDIPWTKESAISYEEYLNLDSITFEQWLKLKFGVVHPHIAEYFQLYCWSSFNGSIEELSALQVLNFVASEVDGVLTLPGGNAAITQRLFDKLQEETTSGSLRSEAFVLKVQKRPSGLVWVTYEDAAGVLKTIEADACIVASPKFVAKLIVDDIPAAQVKLMNDLSYRGYIVGNAIFNKPFKSPSFDVYCFQGEKPPMPAAMDTGNRAFSDVCFGTWAQNDQAPNGVLTVYKALPYDGGRQFLFNPMAHEKHKKIISEELKNFTASVGLNYSDIKGMRMTRWGHSLPVASRGLIQSGYLSKMSQPVGEKIFFANQDNWANPAFECSFAAAKEASAGIRNLI
jgi:protoporphyrinogen oxidase